MEGALSICLRRRNALIGCDTGKRECHCPSLHSRTKGLWDKPTVINNVETLATVPLIMKSGAAEFKKIGHGDIARSTKIVRSYRPRC
jgi:NADH:ubiquinone oxidoreductase subunit F (NADH-binding)